MEAKIAELRAVVELMWGDYVCDADRCSSNDAPGVRGKCLKYHVSKKIQATLANVPFDVFREIVKYGAINPKKAPIRTGAIKLAKNVGDLANQSLFIDMVKIIIPFVATVNIEEVFSEAIKAYFHENIFSIVECDDSLPVLRERLGPLFTESVTKLELFRDVKGAFYHTKHQYRPLYRAIPYVCKGLQHLEVSIAIDGKTYFTNENDFTNIVLRWHAGNMAVFIKQLPKMKFIKFDFAFRHAKPNAWLEPKEVLPAREEDWKNGVGEGGAKFWRFWDVTEIMREQAKAISSVPEKVDRMELDCKVSYRGHPLWWDLAPYRPMAG
ncbi:hypothetical protein MMC10_007067 [Thelotrema lepadinum]|nr:hypothetical protein [Thelotrema lepadinum]